MDVGDAGPAGWGTAVADSNVSIRSVDTAEETVEEALARSLNSSSLVLHLHLFNWPFSWNQSDVSTWRCYSCIVSLLSLQRRK